MGLYAFRAEVTEKEGIQQHITQTLLEMVDKERSNEVIDKCVDWICPPRGDSALVSSGHYFVDKCGYNVRGSFLRSWFLHAIFHRQYSLFFQVRHVGHT